jgi:hypothetical protein
LEVNFIHRPQIIVQDSRIIQIQKKERWRLQRGSSGPTPLVSIATVSERPLVSQ